eukprot:5087985-Ditylum_brightwellii.AAC.1
MVILLPFKNKEKFKELPPFVLPPPLNTAQETNSTDPPLTLKANRSHANKAEAEATTTTSDIAGKRSIPWNSQTTPLMNDIAMAYVAAVSLHKKEYKKLQTLQHIIQKANLKPITRNTCTQLPSLSQTPYTQGNEDFVDSECLLSEDSLDDAESEQEAKLSDDINPSGFGNAVRPSVCSYKDMYVCDGKLILKV